jgi:hypothetical protein
MNTVSSPALFASTPTPARGFRAFETLGEAKALSAERGVPIALALFAFGLFSVGAFKLEASVLGERTGVAYVAGSVLMLAPKALISASVATLMLSAVRGKVSVRSVVPSLASIWKIGLYLLMSFAFKYATIALWGLSVQAAVRTFGISAMLLLFSPLLVDVFVAAFFSWLTSYTSLLIVDHNMSTFAAMATSMRMVASNIFAILGLNFTLVVINLLGLCACGVGLLVTVPFSVLAFAIAYTKMTDA